VYPQGYGQPESASLSNWLTASQATDTTTLPVESLPTPAVPAHP
jgi:hypothetical protein